MERHIDAEPRSTEYEPCGTPDGTDLSGNNKFKHKAL